MDGRRFDTLARQLSRTRSRRQLLSGLVSGVLAGAFATGPGVERRAAAAPPCTGEACATAANCCGGTVCDPTMLSCQPAHGPCVSPLGSTCLDDSTCCATEQCIEGVCAVVRGGCALGNSCVDDSSCCGGEVCASGLCVAAAAAAGCPAGQLRCNGACSTTACGSCDNHCEAQTETCCAGACADLLTSPAHCGSCKAACGQSQTCELGLCVDLPPPDTCAGTCPGGRRDRDCRQRGGTGCFCDLEQDPFVCRRIVTCGGSCTTNADCLGTDEDCVCNPANNTCERGILPVVCGDKTCGPCEGCDFSTFTCVPGCTSACLTCDTVHGQCVFLCGPCQGCNEITGCFDACEDMCSICDPAQGCVSTCDRCEDCVEDSTTGTRACVPFLCEPGRICVPNPDGSRDCVLADPGALSASDEGSRRIQRERGRRDAGSGTKDEAKQTNRHKSTRRKSKHRAKRHRRDGKDQDSRRGERGRQRETGR
jgi:hypothetical protein